MIVGVLRRFVLDNPVCTHYLFLDADACFLEDHSLNVMLGELEDASDAFGIYPRMSWDGEEYLDTFKLMTKVMKTHGLKHIMSSKMVLHFFCVSYIWEPTQQWNETKAQRRDEFLSNFRQADPVTGSDNAT